MSNAAFIGLSLSAATATVVTVAGVNGVFDPWINPEKTISLEQAPAALIGGPASDKPADTTTQANSQPGANAPATATGETGSGDQVAALSNEEEAEAITPTQKPSVDIVRVEPSGDAVIAGQSDAGALVAVLSNGKVIGKGVANAAGDWAIVLDKPLEPGAHDIAVEARRAENTEPVRADGSIAVLIPENESEGVLVATNQPGVPTEVLQVPDAAKTIVADRMENEGKQQGVAAPTAKPKADETPDLQGTVVTATAPRTDEGTIQTDPSDIIVAAKEPMPQPASEPDVVVAAEPEVVKLPESEDVTVVAQADVKTRSMVAEPKAQEIVAAAIAPTVPIVSNPEPMVKSALELKSAEEPNSLGEPKSTGEQIAGDETQAQAAAPAADAEPVQPAKRIEQALETVEGELESKIESTLETAALLPQPDAEVSSPVLVQPKAKPEIAAPVAEVASSPEATVEPTAAAEPMAAAEPGVDIAPKTTAEPTIETASKPEPVVVANVEPKKEPKPDIVNQVAKPQPEPSVTVQAVEADEGQVYVAGESTGKGPVRVYIEEKFVGQTKPNPQGQWILKAPKEIDPGQHSVRADKVQDDKGTVTARAEVVFEREADEVALTPVIAVGTGASNVAAGADVDAGRRRIPAMIIRKGDNLWRISRRHYGHGVRYTTIYQANQGQIRNPNMIFPGQVFLLPQRDLNWASN